MRYSIILRRLAPLIVLVTLLGCEPSDRRPGLWLSGEMAQSAPEDWGFTNAHQEIFVQVKTPYLIPHSVTIWCAEVDGDLFIGARNPDDKNWPGWMARSPKVVLKIGNTLYQVTTAQINEPEKIAKIKAAYAEKYQLSTEPGSAPPPMRYWLVRA